MSHGFPPHAEIPPVESGRAKVLLVEDDPTFAEELSIYLGHHGIALTTRADTDGLLDELRAQRPDGLILDQFVAGQDLLDMIATLRQVYAGPLLFLTGNTDPVDRIVCLDRGADDFLSKTIAPREVVARLRALLRRARTAAAPPRPPAPVSDVIALGGWSLAPAGRLLTAPDGRRARLTDHEAALLAVLMARANQVVARETVYPVLFNRPYVPGSRTLDNLVSRCRDAVREVGGTLSVRAVRGSGYILHGFSRDATTKRPTRR